MRNYKRIMLAGLILSVALMGCSRTEGREQGREENQTESGVETGLEEELKTGAAGEATMA